MLKSTYENAEEIPEKFKELYEERDGAFHLTGVEGVKTQSDIDRLKNSLQRSRSEYKELKKQLESLQAPAQEEDDTAAEGSAAPKARPDRRVEYLQKELEKSMQIIGQFQEESKKRSIHDALRSEALKSNVTKTAIDDILVIGERHFDVDADGHVYTKDANALSPSEWLSSMEKVRPHWWPSSGAGPVKGSVRDGSVAYSGVNPWAPESFNMTAQGKIMKENPTLAEQLMSVTKPKSPD